MFVARAVSGTLLACGMIMTNPLLLLSRLFGEMSQLSSTPFLNFRRKRLKSCLDLIGHQISIAAYKSEEKQIVQVKVLGMTRADVKMKEKES